MVCSKAVHQLTRKQSRICNLCSGSARALATSAGTLLQSSTRGNLRNARAELKHDPRFRRAPSPTACLPRSALDLIYLKLLLTFDAGRPRAIRSQAKSKEKPNQVASRRSSLPFVILVSTGAELSSPCRASQVATTPSSAPFGDSFVPPATRRSSRAAGHSPLPCFTVVTACATFSAHRTFSSWPS